LRPAETCETSSEPVAPASVSKRSAAMSSVSTAWASPPLARAKDAVASPRRVSWAVAVRAATAVRRWPLRNSIRSHQCEPMSAKARERPPSPASTRQL
jgi:hypothetical protein